MDAIDAKSFDKLDDYISDNLSPEERAEFEKRLRNEPLLKEWHDWMTTASSDLEQIEIANKKEQIKLWLKDDASKEKSTDKSGSPFKKTILLLLIGLVVSLLAYLLFSKSDQVDVPQYAEQLIGTPYKNPIILRNTETGDWEKAIDHYADGDYTKFLADIQPLIDAGEANNEQRFYYALSLLYQSPTNCTKAIEGFSALIGFNNGYDEQSLWFRSLTLIRCNKLDEAKKDLQKIIESGTFQVQEARKLLANM